ncbi:PAS domain-containing sensor histidine kinase [Uliginosibacterium flavum]|uniref:histidine kinase n=1 Tax=Uliginosibacterium flavum TaxID=1396831 RepID=A0ABV2TRM7_9RHOO
MPIHRLTPDRPAPAALAHAGGVSMGLRIVACLLASVACLGGLLLVFGGQALGLIGLSVGGLLVLAWMLLDRQRWAEHLARAMTAEQSYSRARLERALDATQDGVWEFDAQRQTLFCSDHCMNLTGNGNVLASPLRCFLRCLSREQRRRLLRALREAWNEAGRFDELVSITHADGRKRWLRVRASVAADRTFVTGALSDVTDEVELTRERGHYQSFMEGVIDSLPLPMSVKNAAGVLVLANRAYCQAMHLQPGEVMGRRAHQMVHSEMAERLEELDRLALETGRAHVLEDWFDISRAQRRVFLRITKSRCVDPNGDLVVVTTYEDQSALRDYARRMGELSMNVEAFVQRLIRTIPHPIYVKSADSRYLMVNPAIAEQWGLRTEDMIGMSSRELFGDEPGIAIEEEDRRVLAGEVISKEDCLPDRKTGVPRYWAVTKALCTDVDGNSIIVGSNFEITGLRRSEIELREALQRQTNLRQFLQQLFDALPHPMFVKDRQHRYVMTNRAHALFHGCNTDGILGTTSFEHADPDVAEAVEREEESIFDGFAGNAVIESEHVLHDCEGKPHQTLIRKVACDGADGERVVVGITFDVSETRALERELRETLTRQTRNRAFLQDVFDAIPTPVAVKDEHHVYVMANRALANAYGLTPDRMLGKTTWDFNLPAVAQETVLADDRLFSIGPGVVSEREIPIRYADGKLHRVHLRKVVCLDPDGARLIITSNSDVTDLLEKESALTASLQRQTRSGEFLQTVFDALPFATYVKDERLCYVMANTALSEFHGLSKHAFAGKRAAELVSESTAQELEALDQLLLERDDGELLSNELLMRDRLGRTRSILSHKKLVRDADGKRVIIGLNQDVSPLREAEQAQRRALERLDTLIHNAPLGITLLDREGHFLQANPCLQRLLGRSEEQLREMCYQDIVPQRFLVQGDEKIEEIRRAGVMQPFENCLLGSDGQELPVMVSGVLVGRGEQSLAYWLLVQDLVEQKAAEDELLRHRDQLRELVLEQTADLLQAKENAERGSAAKSDFIAQLSHELRTPLHAILSFARLGVERGERLTPDKVCDYFSRVSESGERLLGLLDELLDLAKLEAGRVSLSLQLVDLPALLDDAAREFEALFVAHQLALSRIDLMSLPAVNMDAARIGQVLRNLLSNAVKFAPPGSRVTLQTRIVDDGRGRRAGESVETCMVEIAVIDEGPGIPAEELEQIFDRFTQSSLTRTVAGGTGLGLAICREIVLAHRGQICARNRPAGGAEFIVRLPLPASGIESTDVRNDA